MSGLSFFRIFHLFNGFVSLAPVTCFPVLGLGRIGQVLLNEFNFDLIFWLYDSRISLYHVVVSSSLILRCFLRANDAKIVRSGDAQCNTENHLNYSTKQQ